MSSTPPVSVLLIGDENPVRENFLTALGKFASPSPDVMTEGSSQIE